MNIKSLPYRICDIITLKPALQVERDCKGLIKIFQKAVIIIVMKNQEKFTGLISLGYRGKNILISMRWEFFITYE